MQVDIVRSSTMNFQFNPVFDGENIADTQYIAIFKGFLHPDSAPAEKSPLKVYLVAAAAQATLYVSTDYKPDNKVFYLHASTRGEFMKNLYWKEIK